MGNGQHKNDHMLTERGVVSANVVARGELCSQGGFSDFRRAQHAHFVRRHPIAAGFLFCLHAGELRGRAEEKKKRRDIIRWMRYYVRVNYARIMPREILLVLHPDHSQLRFDRSIRSILHRHYGKYVRLKRPSFVKATMSTILIEYAVYSENVH